MMTTTEEVRELLRAFPAGLHTVEIEDMLRIRGITRNAIDVVLKRMTEEGTVIRVARGFYRNDEA
jgi:predicted transcriptional regulator of viral defense system